MADQMERKETRKTRALNVRELPTASVRPRKNNARRHSEKQIHQIAQSIEAFGFTVPILIDAEGRILAGHGRLAAAKLLKLDQVPTISVDDLTEEEARAYMLADNRIAENATWDYDILKTELNDLAVSFPAFEIDLTGFSGSEIDTIVYGGDTTQSGLQRVLGKDAARKPDPDDALPASDPNNRPITQPGMVWVMGPHRLICGDSTKADTYERLFRTRDDGKREQADLIFTDPPYNVPIAGHVGGLGSIAHREFAMAAGEMTTQEFQSFLATVFARCVQVSKDGSVHFICMDWRHMREVLDAAKDIYSDLLNLCVWNKDNGGMGSLYRSKHELVFVFKHGTAPHTNNIKLGSAGRYRTNVWDYPGVNSFSGRGDLEMHPTVKPVALVADAIRDCSKRHGIVLDPFGGSGSTLIAAERTGRQARLVEIDPLYCDTIVRRWQKVTEKAAVDEMLGIPFAEYAERP